MKPCPYCSEQIENDAAQCPRCQRWLDPALDRTLNADSPPVLLPPRSLSGLAIASLVCGIFWILGIGSLAALILGYLALRQIRRNPFRVSGRRLAIAGVVLGWLGIAGTVLLIFLGFQIWKIKREYYTRPQTTQIHTISQPQAPALLPTLVSSRRRAPVS